jgi:hypothetical protein
VGHPVVTVPAPPCRFDALTHVVPEGEMLHRVHHPARDANVFNPGVGAPTRFAPLIMNGTPVPTLYAAQTAEAAVCETILHDVPLAGGLLPYARYAPLVETTLLLSREVRLAKLMGDGLRRLGVAPQELTATSGDVYADTVRWAHAAHGAGFDGLVWMSARDNTSAAYVLFGDRVSASDLRIGSNGVGSFAPATRGFDWLSGYCSRVRVELLLT